MTSNNSNKQLNKDLKGTINTQSHVIAQATSVAGKTTMIRKSDLNAGISFRTLTDDEVAQSQLIGEYVPKRGNAELLVSPSADPKSSAEDAPLENNRSPPIRTLTKGLNQDSEQLIKLNNDLSQRQKVIINKHLRMK